VWLRRQQHPAECRLDICAKVKIALFLVLLIIDVSWLGNKYVLCDDFVWYSRIVIFCEMTFVLLSLIRACSMSMYRRKNAPTISIVHQSHIEQEDLALAGRPTSKPISFRAKDHERRIVLVHLSQPSPGSRRLPSRRGYRHRGLFFRIAPSPAVAVFHHTEAAAANRTPPPRPTPSSRTRISACRLTSNAADQGMISACRHAETGTSKPLLARYAAALGYNILIRIQQSNVICPRRLVPF
jgi:hypothetical protein